MVSVLGKPRDLNVKDIWLTSNPMVLTRRSKFFELQRKLGIPSIRKPGLSPEEIDRAVLTEVEADVNQRKGPVAVKEMLKSKSLILVPR